MTQTVICVKLVAMKKPIPLKLMTKPFSVREAIAHGLSKATLTRMVRSDRLERLSRGIYQASHTEGGMEESAYKVATLRCGIPSAICLLSALENYHVTDQIPKQTWILVPQSKRVSSKDIKLIRSRNPQWDIGIRKTKMYWITTLERTLVECLLHKQKIGSQVALEAIKQALAQKKAKLGDLYNMAKKMGVEHRVRHYIEALSS